MQICRKYDIERKPITIYKQAIHVRSVLISSEMQCKAVYLFIISQRRVHVSFYKVNRTIGGVYCLIRLLKRTGVLKQGLCYAQLWQPGKFVTTGIQLVEPILGVLLFLIA